MDLWVVLTLQQYVLRRFGILMTVWLASSVIFIIPRLAPGDPIQSMISRMSESAGYVENSEKIVEGFKERFGLNDPIYVQYGRYLGGLVSLDLGVSLAMFPTPVKEIVGRALPWSIGLMSISLVLYFYWKSIWCFVILEKNTNICKNCDFSLNDFYINTWDFVCSNSNLYFCF